MAEFKTAILASEAYISGRSISNNLGGVQLFFNSMETREILFNFSLPRTSALNKGSKLTGIYVNYRVISGSLNSVTTILQNQKYINGQLVMTENIPLNAPIPAFALTPTTTDNVIFESVTTPAFFADDIDVVLKYNFKIIFESAEISKIELFSVETRYEAAVSGGLPSQEILITVSSESSFTTIKAAIAYATSILPKRSAIVVYPGTYIEDNPLALIDGLTLTAIGNIFPTIIAAANPLQNLINLGNGSMIYGFTLIGTTAYAISYNGSTGTAVGSVVKDCVIVDCTNGVIVDSGPGDLVCSNLLLRTNAATMTNALFAQNGGTIRNFSAAISSRGPVVTNGCIATGANSLIVFNDGGFEDVQNAVVVENDGTIEIKNTFIRGSNIAYTVRGTGSPKLSAISTIVGLTDSLDLSVLSALGIIYIDGGEMRYDKISNDNNVPIRANFFSQTPNDQSLQVLGELHVGTYNFPAESAMGGGDSYTSTMTVQSDDGAGNFVNISTDAADFNTTTNLLQGLGAGNIVYIGAPQIFFGIKSTIETAWTVGDSNNVIFEFWSGVWTQFRIMVTRASNPYDSRVQRIFESPLDENVRFGFTAASGWVKTEINGINKFWVRMRLTGAITSMPVIRQIKLQPCRLHINLDGYREYFGGGRSIDMLNWDMGLVEAANASPSTNDVFVSDNLAVGLQLNNLVNATTDRIGFNNCLPHNLDTSMPLKFLWNAIATAAGGNFVFVLRWGYTNSGFNVYTSTAAAPNAGPNERSLTLTLAAPAAINTQITYTAYMDVSNFNPQPATGGPDVLWVTLERLGANIADTNTGNCILVQIQGSYIKWNDGGNLSGY